VFTTGRPEPLLAALRAQAGLPGVRDFLASGADLRRDRGNWATSEPAVSPDGEAVYFASNVGIGMGASGNTSFVVFKADTARTRVIALGKLGPIDGRVPKLAVSPDGRRLLVATSRHSSAVENPVYLYAVDLVTQKATELVMSDPRARGRTSLVDGFCWLPDSRFVAVSAAYYTTYDAIHKPDFELRDADYTLYVKDASTSKTLRRVEGARAPSCGAGR
jgi:hypothetical protein